MDSPTADLRPRQELDWMEEDRWWTTVNEVRF
ncbi:hypothetical protein ES702_00527 [subsurface metagenome]